MEYIRIGGLTYWPDSRAAQQGNPDPASSVEYWRALKRYDNRKLPTWVRAAALDEMEAILRSAPPPLTRYWVSSKDPVKSGPLPRNVPKLHTTDPEDFMAWDCLDDTQQFLDYVLNV